MQQGRRESDQMAEISPDITFIVPALNEESNLLPLFERLLKLGNHLGHQTEILVVDDASTDQTLQVAQRASKAHPEIRVVYKALPHGIGRGFRFALSHARGRIGIIVMADGVDPLEEAVPHFCEKILNDECQLVLLSRYTSAENASSIPFSYKFFHVLFRFCATHLLGVPFRDTTYAFRAMDLHFVRRLGLRGNGFEISPELTFKTYFAGGKIGEVAGSQTRRVRGRSKFLFSKAAWGYFSVLAEGFTIRLGRIRFLSGLRRTA